MTRPDSAEFTLWQLTSELNEWIDQSPENEKRDRLDASRRMIACWEQKSTDLDLSRLYLTSLPTTIGKLALLTKLNLSDNELETIPDSIRNLGSLTELNLYNNKFRTIPDSICNLDSLTELNLSRNQLETIPDSIGKLASLTRLYLSNNQLKTIPDSIGNLKSLIGLSLYRNQLKTIPDSIVKLPSLTWLELHSNQLKTIPDSIGELVLLTNLYLSNNQLKTIPSSIGNLKSLTRLSLHNNPKLTNIPTASLPENLKLLILTDCPQLQFTKKLIARLSDLSNEYCEIRFPQHFNLDNFTKTQFRVASIKEYQPPAITENPYENYEQQHGQGNNEPETFLEVPFTKPSLLRYLQNLVSAVTCRTVAIHSENPPTTPNSTTKITTAERFLKFLGTDKTNNR